MTDEELLLHCDSILSFILYREKNELSHQTLDDIGKLLPELRLATSRNESIRRNSR